MTLFRRMTEVAEQARQQGLLVSIPNQVEPLDEAGMPYVLRFAPQLVEKIRATKMTPRANPFLPPEPELFVAAVGDQHSLILNKFNVLPLHGLLVTNAFVDQVSQLTLADFAAVACLLRDEDALVFYNGGELAGASQAHRHFQLVPRDLGLGELPVQRLLAGYRDQPQAQIWPFAHRLCWLANYSPETLFEAWRKLEYSWQHYNLLLTRQWMLVVPRRAEQAAGISINSLAFAGALLAKDERELSLIRRQGPLALLAQVTVPG